MALNMFNLETCLKIELKTDIRGIVRNFSFNKSIDFSDPGGG